MKTGFILVFCFAIALLSSIQINGDIDQSQQWSEDVYINSDIIISSTAVITIDPGINVIFTGYYSIELNDEVSLLAEGTVDSPITFTADWDLDSTYGEDGVTPERWNGIRYLNMDSPAGTSLYTHCRFEYAHKNDSVNGLDNKYGGVLYVESFSHIELLNCEFTANTVEGNTTAYGGAIYLKYSDIEIINCNFNNNSAEVNVPFNGKGGAIYLYRSSPDIMNTRFSQNSADDAGGALAADNAWYAIIGNCIFDNNTADDGGAIFLYDSDIYLINCIIADNQGQYGGGIHFKYGNPTIGNTIISGNTTTFRAPQVYIDGSAPEFNSCLIEGNDTAFYSTGGSNYIYDADCIDVDPQFDNTNPLLPYHPADGAPTIDNGVYLWYCQYLEFDLIGNLRVANGTIDMGVYEIKDAIRMQYSNIDFADTEINQTTAETCWFYNESLNDVNINSFSVDSEFYSVLNADVLLAAEDSLLIHIEFSPLVMGSVNATLTVETDSGDFTVGLHGLAQARIITDDNYARTIHCLIGDTKIYPLYFINDGNTPLEITEVLASSATIAVNTILPVTIQPGDFTQIDFAYTPVSLDQENIVFTVTSDAHNNNSLELSQTGKGDKIPTPQNLILTEVDGVIQLNWNEILLTYYGFSLENVSYIIEKCDTPEFNQIERINSNTNSYQYTPDDMSKRSFFRIVGTTQR